jgi:hypothetical protein
MNSKYANQLIDTGAIRIWSLEYLKKLKSPKAIFFYGDGCGIRDGKKLYLSPGNQFFIWSTSESYCDYEKTNSYVMS